MTAHINIGTNKGDRTANIERAVALLASFTKNPLRVSKAYDSEPWGFESKNRFKNVGVELETELSSESLLNVLRKIEVEIDGASHRDTAGNYVDRAIDLDLIYYGDVVMNSPELVLPHPRLHLREFVLLPLVELSPDWVHPILKMNSTEMMNSLKNKKYNNIKTL